MHLVVCEIEEMSHNVTPIENYSESKFLPLFLAVYPHYKDKWSQPWKRFPMDSEWDLERTTAHFRLGMYHFYGAAYLGFHRWSTSCVPIGLAILLHASNFKTWNIRTTGSNAFGTHPETVSFPCPVEWFIYHSNKIFVYCHFSNHAMQKQVIQPASN